MIWRVTVRQYAPGYWRFFIRQGHKVLRRGSFYQTQGEAGYAAGLATGALIASSKSLPTIIKKIDAP